MKKTLISIAILVIVQACGQMANKERAVEKTPSTTLSATEQNFLNNLSSLCGKSFAGKETYTAPGRDSWAHKKFIMHVTVCEPDRVNIPFHLDEDHSRTWMFMADEHGLRFRHDHRHDDGTPEDVTLYGGYADGSGNGFIQRFPADDYTNNMLNDGVSRQWNVILAEDLTSLTYQLIYKGDLVFEALFDLTSPL